MQEAKRRILLSAVLVGVTIFTTTPTPAQFDSALDDFLTTPAQQVTVTLVPSHTIVTPGQAFRIAAVVDIQPGRWLYSPTPRGSLAQARPLEIRASADGWTIEPTRYPSPAWHKLEVAGVVEHNLAYENRLIAYIPVTAPADATQAGTIAVQLAGQTCDAKGCYNVDAKASTTVQVGPVAAAAEDFPAPPAKLQTAAELEAQMPQTRDEEKVSPLPAAPDAPGASLTTWIALTLAMLAGLALNVMPCVLPVIPIKIMSLLQQAKESRSRAVTLGMSYAAGMVLFFLAVGAVSMIVRLTTGQMFNLSDPLRIPAVIIALVLLLIAAAMWLLNVFTIAIGGQWAGKASQAGHAGSLGMGFFTGILATPCSGPVLAAVFGWAQGKPVWASGAAFAALGVGMAAPHAVLAAFPALLEKLPAPGMWMERLKQGMAFILLLVSAWLLTSLGDVGWIGWVLAYCVVFAACLWMAGVWVNFNTPARKRRTVRTLALVLAIASGAAMLPRPAPSAILWRDYDPATLNEAISSGKVVLVKFTADTCTICKILDIKVYNRESTAKALAAREVVTIEGDTTQRQYPASIALTERLREAGPPVTVLYGPGTGEPIRLHGVFSQSELLDAVDRAAGKTEQK